MARNFNGTAANGTGEYLEVDATPVTGYPLSISAWFYPDDTTNFKELVSIIDKDDPNQWLIRFSAGNDGAVWAMSRDSATNDGIAKSTASYTANTWNHAGGTFTGSGRAAFVNGGSKGTNAVAKSPTGVDRISIGRAGDSTPSDPMKGRIAEVAVWTVELSDGEIALLARGVSPLRIRPVSLVLYYPIYGTASPEPNLAVGGTTYQLTISATPDQADHAPVMSPFAFAAEWFGAFTPAGGGGGGTVAQAFSFTLMGVQ